MRVQENLLKEFYGSSMQLQDFRDGMTLLERSRILDILRLNGLVRPQDNTEKYALEAARSQGYMDALADLINFVEANQPEKRDKPIADFGAIDDLVKRGILTPEEADNERRKRTGNNTTYRNPLAAASAGSATGPSGTR